MTRLDRAIDRAMIGIVIVLIILTVLVLMAGAVDIASQMQCESMGFDEGGYSFTTQQIVCEYRLEVPLNELYPPANQGGSNDTSHVPGQVRVGLRSGV